MNSRLSAALLVALLASSTAGAGSRENGVVPLPKWQERDWAGQLAYGPYPYAQDKRRWRPARAGYRPRPKRGLLEVLFVPGEGEPGYRYVAPRVHVAPVPVYLPRRAPRAYERAVRRPVIAPEFLPAIVVYDLGHAPGTIVIDTSSRHLYLVLEGGKAKRYGVGVGREGFSWVGSVKVGRKAEWPDWRPPAEMLERRPELPTFMAGGPENPLGARALYLYRGGEDTLFRIHGSNEPWTIGTAVSSGCIRMRNEDVTDLYNRVKIGTKVVVM